MNLLTERMNHFVDEDRVIRGHFKYTSERFHCGPALWYSLRFYFTL